MRDWKPEVEWMIDDAVSQLKFIKHCYAKGIAHKYLSDLEYITANIMSVYEEISNGSEKQHQVAVALESA